MRPDVLDKISASGLTTGCSKPTGPPVIQEAAAVLECRLKRRSRTGTHVLVVGEVRRASVSEGFRDYWDFRLYQPILYAGTEQRNGKRWVFRSLSGKKVLVPVKD